MDAVTKNVPRSSACISATRVVQWPTTLQSVFSAFFLHSDKFNSIHAAICYYFHVRSKWRTFIYPVPQTNSLARVLPDQYVHHVIQIHTSKEMLPALAQNLKWYVASNTDWRRVA